MQKYYAMPHERQASCEVLRCEEVYRASDVDRELSGLRKLLPQVLPSMKYLIQDGCDHSVGICCCADIRAVEQMEQYLAASQEPTP